MKCRAVLRLALAPVVEAGSGHVGVAEPFLDLGDVRVIGEALVAPIGFVESMQRQFRRLSHKEEYSRRVSNQGSRCSAVRRGVTMNSGARQTYSAAIALASAGNRWTWFTAAFTWNQVETLKTGADSKSELWPRSLRYRGDSAPSECPRKPEGRG